jgi:hypothetical protein
MKKYIKITDSFQKDFLSPISYVTDKVILKIKDGKMSVSTHTPDSVIIMHTTINIDSNLEEERINIGNIKKLKNHIDNATDLQDSDELIVESNKLRYKSNKWRFSLHLMEDGILPDSRMDVDKIAGFEASTTFDLSYASVREIIKLKSANSDAEKVYFKFTDEGVHADVTDYAISNIDESGVKIADSFVGDQNTLGCPVVFELIKLLSQHKGMDFIVKYNSRGAFLFQYATPDVTISYVISEVKN